MHPLTGRQTSLIISDYMTKAVYAGEPRDLCSSRVLMTPNFQVSSTDCLPPESTATTGTRERAPVMRPHAMSTFMTEILQEDKDQVGAHMSTCQH